MSILEGIGMYPRESRGRFDYRWASGGAKSSLSLQARRSRRLRRPNSSVGSICKLPGWRCSSPRQNGSCNCSEGGTPPKGHCPCTQKEEGEISVRPRRCCEQLLNDSDTDIHNHLNGFMFRTLRDAESIAMLHYLFGLKNGMQTIGNRGGKGSSVWGLLRRGAGWEVQLKRLKLGHVESELLEATCHWAKAGRDLTGT